MCILLTGGSGFIGRHLKEKLGAKYRILAPRHQELDFTNQEAVNTFFQAHSVSRIIHSATKPGHRNAKDYDNILRANMLMFANLFEISKQFPIEKIIFLGSGSEFDLENYWPKMKEEDLGRFIPKDPTGLSKFLATKMLSSYSNAINLRFFGIFGEYEDYSIRFISNAIGKAILDLPITIKQDRKFDYVDVEDGIKIIDLFLELPPNHYLYKDYNVTPNCSVYLSEIAEMVRDIAGKPQLPIIINHKAKGLEYSGCNRRLYEQFPNFKFTPLKNSIFRLYQWYNNNLKTIDKACFLQDK